MKSWLVSMADPYSMAFFWPHITGNSNPTTCLFIAQFTPLSPFTSWLWLKPCDISTKRLASLFLQESAEFTRKIESRRFPKTRRFGVSFPWSSLKLTPSLLEGSSKDQPTQAISRVNSTNHVAFKTKQPCIISAASLFSVCLFGVFVFFEHQKNEKSTWIHQATYHETPPHLTKLKSEKFPKFSWPTYSSHFGPYNTRSKTAFLYGCFRK